MPRIATKVIDLQQLAREPGASLVVRLMMACNDLALSNECLGWYDGRLSVTEKHLRTGARLYFLRLQLGHLTEAMKVVAEITADPFLMSVVRTCHPFAQEALERLRFFADGGAQHGWSQANVASVRHNLTFHYHESGKWVDWALSDRASRKEARWSSITRGDQAKRWRFNVADDIIDSIICRKIWKIPRSADLREVADENVARVFEILKDLLDFSGDFIWRFAAS